MARPKGALGKNKAFLLNRLKAMYGKDFDPVMKIAENAMRLDKIAEDAMIALEQIATSDAKSLDDLKAMSSIAEQARPAIVDAVNAWDKLSVYCKPKLKAIAIDGNLDVKTLVKIIDLSGEAPHLDLNDVEKLAELEKIPNKKIVVKSKAK